MGTVCVRLPEEIYKRLGSLSSQTGRTKTYYVREAILDRLEEMEDIYVSLKRLKKPEKTYSLEEVEKNLYLGSQVR